jgi:hypothetical protein
VAVGVHIWCTDRSSGSRDKSRGEACAGSRQGLVGGRACRRLAALMFDPRPVLSWGNVIPLLVFVPASIYSVLYTLSASYLI